MTIYEVWDTGRKELVATFSDKEKAEQYLWTYETYQVGKAKIVAIKGRKEIVIEEGL